MRRLTVFVVSTWIRIAGLPAFIEGNYIHVPSGTFEVEGGCAGLRYTLVALALATFVSLFHRRRWLSALLLMACALTLAQVGNWIRVFITVAVGLSPDGSVSLFVRDEHTLFGWILFIVFMLPLVYLNRVLQSDADQEASATAITHKMPRLPWRKPVVSASCVVLAAGIWLNHGTIFRVEGEPSNHVVLRAPVIAGWSATVDWNDARVPIFVGANGQTGIWYEDGGARVGAYLATYANQASDNDVAANSNQPAGARAALVARRTATVAAPRITLPFEELEVVDLGIERSRLVWVGLRVGGHVTASSVVAKFLQVPSVIGGRRDAQALVLTALCDINCNDARSTLSRFAAAGAQSLYLEAEQSLSREVGVE
jgi:EpsI family protein